MSMRKSRSRQLVSLLNISVVLLYLISAFGKEYLRSPNTADVAHLLQEGEARGFPDMLGSIDYMH
jgi:hypothetical protein